MEDLKIILSYYDRIKDDYDDYLDNHHEYDFTDDLDWIIRTIIESDSSGEAEADLIECLDTYIMTGAKEVVRLYTEDED